MKLANKIAVITGGSSGIGLAREFIANGAKLAIFEHDRQTLNHAIVSTIETRGARNETLN